MRSSGSPSMAWWWCRVGAWPSGRSIRRRRARSSSAKAWCMGSSIRHGAFLRHNQELRARGRGAGAQVPAPRRAGGRRAPSSPSTMRACRRDLWSGQQFERWRREAERSNPKLLFLTRAQLMRHARRRDHRGALPGERWKSVVCATRLTTASSPGIALDGVTMTVPLHLLNQVDERRCEWLVPGLLRDKISHLIRGLPKNLRKHFVPVPQFVTAVHGGSRCPRPGRCCRRCPRRSCARPASRCRRMPGTSRICRHSCA